MRGTFLTAAVVAGFWLAGPTTGASLAVTDTPVPAALAGRQILLYDPAGDGRIVEAVGDLATARRIAVLVPGVDTTLADFDRGLGGVSRRALSKQIRALHDATGDGVAVVGWLGYDPPEGIGRDALRRDRALAGAVALRAFVTALAVRHPQATVTVVGHSYGALVMGLAAPGLPPAVTDLVALGSTGLGVSSVDDLGTRARVWAGTAAGDWTRRLPGWQVLGLGHGRHPTDPSFGARRVPVDGVRGHDGYLVPGTDCLAALARIVAGR